MPFRARSWLIVGAAGVGVFALSWLLRPIDEPVGRALVGTPGLVMVAGGMAFLGGISFLGPLSLGIAIGLGAVGRWWGAGRIVLVTLLSDGIARLVKLAFERPRPEYQIPDAGGFSFPSGHATTGGALAVLLAWFALRHLRGQTLVVWALSLAVAWAAAMALSRLVLGVHYLSDVVAGIGLGMSIAGGILGLSILLERRFRARGSP